MSTGAKRLNRMPLYLFDGTDQAEGEAKEDEADGVSYS